MTEIFIQEWNRADTDGCRIRSSKSAGKIGGEHAYACQHLTTWFRLGKYIIKHDHANYLLGLIREIGTDDVKSMERDEEGGGWIDKFHVDDIVNVVNRHFSGNDYIQTLLLLQEELQGYEKCYFISAFYRLDFDYALFLEDKDAYQAKLEEFVKEVKRTERWG